MIEKLKQRYKGYKEKRFLETHGCKTWREYELKHDPDIGYLARQSHTFYHGYAQVFPVEPLGYDPYMNRINQMVKWCEKNCQGKWRNDWLRGFYDQQGNFEFNGIGGVDLMFFAFKEESDYVWFTLVWS
jgi:hypothetical protein